MFDLKGRTMAITGAAGPKHNPIVDMALKNGMNVAFLSAFHSRAQIAIEKAVDPQYKDQVIGFAQNPQARIAQNMAEAPDLYHEDTTQADVMEWIYKRFGSIDVIVNGSGGKERQNMYDTDKALWHHSAEVPEACFFNTMYALKYLEKSKCPRVINLLTDDGFAGGWFKNPSFASSRGGAMALTREMAKELGPKGITVNSVIHSYIDEVPNGITEEEREDMIAHTPLGRLCTRADLAGIICFLASEESSFITGACINVTGGLLLG